MACFRHRADALRGQSVEDVLLPCPHSPQGHVLACGTFLWVPDLRATKKDSSD